MRAWYILRSRLRSVFFRDRREDDLSEELRLHLERQTEAWIAQGIDPAEAKQRARRQFGNIESLKEESRDARGLATWDAIVRDTRHAARRLVHDWRFSVPAVLLLGLGIGANTAIFSVINAALIRGSSLIDVTGLVEVFPNGRSGAPMLATYPAYQDIAAHTEVFASAMTASMPDAVTYRDGSGMRQGVAEFASASYMDVLGLRPSLGRWFTADEERPGAGLVTVIGHRIWTTRFGADPAAVGRTLHIEGQPVTIIGVAPEGYNATAKLGVVTDFWMPPQAFAVMRGVPRVLERNAFEAPFFVKARLRDGVTLAQARAAMDSLSRRLAVEYPKDEPGKGITVLPAGEVRIHPGIDGFLKGVASLLVGVLAIVLAIACSSLATLLLVRASARSKEVAVRLAIGATRRQIIRHLLVESLLLSLAGGAAGCTLAWWAVRGIAALDLPITMDLSVDVTVLMYALTLSVFTGLLFGLAPALKATRLDLTSAIRQDGEDGGSRRRFTLRNGLVVFQVTVSVVLLAATGVFLQAVTAARAQRVGFAVDGVAMLRTDPRSAGYADGRTAVLFDELRTRIGRLPGVDTTVLVRGVVMSPAGLPVVLEGDDTSARSTRDAGSIWVDTGFFEALDIPILFGRAIDDRDRPGAPATAVVSETMARQYFGAVNAIGRRFRIEGEDAWVTIVGVARDTGTDSRVDDLVDPTPRLFFRSFRQAGHQPTGVLARTSGDAERLLGPMQRELLAIDPQLPIAMARTMAQELDASLLLPQAVAGFLGGIGVLGLTLAGVGLYAVIAFTVARKSREIGIRMALGAGRGDVVGDVARDVAAVLGAGAATGLTLAVLVVLSMRAFSNPAPGVVFFSPSVDPLQLLAIVGFILAVGVAAAFVPARRAAKMNPLSALRHE
jgi:predicted permease